MVQLHLETGNVWRCFGLSQLGWEYGWHLMGRGWDAAKRSFHTTGQLASTGFTQVQIISDKVETPCLRGDPEAHKQQPGCSVFIGVNYIRLLQEEWIKSVCSVYTINGNYHFPPGFIYDAELSCRFMCHLGGLNYTQRVEGSIHIILHAPAD